MIRIEWQDDGTVEELPESTRCTSTRDDLKRTPTARASFFGSPGEEGAFVALTCDFPEGPYMIGNSRWVRLGDWKRPPRHPFGLLYIETTPGDPVWRLGRMIWPRGKKWE